MIRVLFYLGSLGAGGAERQTLELVRLLDRRRFQPVIYLQQRQGDLLSQVPEDVPLHSFLPAGPLSMWQRLLGKMGLLDRWQARHLANVIHQERVGIICDQTWPALMITSAASRHAPVKRVSMWVAAPLKELDDYGLKWTPARWRKTRRALATATRALANSRQLGDRVVEFFQLAELGTRLDIFPNMLDVERIDRAASAPEAVPELAADRLQIVCGGRLIPVKGYRFLLDAIRQLVHEQQRSAIQLTILGQGPQLEELQQLCRDWRITEQVHFQGYVANPWAWYRRADLFCLPSLSEGLPNALLEAVLCGVPVLASDCDFGPREILDHGNYGELVPPGNAAALVSAIADRLDAPAKWQARTGPAREFVIQHYSSQMLVPRWEALFEDLVPNHNG